MQVFRSASGDPLMQDQDERSERDLLDESLSMHLELRPGKTLSQIEEPHAVEEADWPRFRRLTFFSVLVRLSAEPLTGASLEMPNTCAS